MIIVPDIIEDFINQLDFTFDFKSATYDGTNTTITIENTLHLRAGMSVVIIGFSFQVISVDSAANSLVVPGDLSQIANPGRTVTLPTPFFFHGTSYAVNSHISRLKDPEKVPMIFLLEILRIDIGAPGNDRGRYSNVRLFFLDVANYADWDTDQHYSNVIVPQTKLCDYFVSQARNSTRYFIEVGSGYQIPHVKFGEYKDGKGHLQSIFNDRLSGVELNIEFLFKTESCN